MTTRFFHPIIASRKHLSASVRTRDIVLTIMLWWIYIFFIRDLFAFLADVARWAWHGFANARNYPSFEILPTLLSYVEIMGVFAVIYIGWARYNQLRFRGKSRRRAAPPVAPEDLAAFYDLLVRQVEAWQHAKILTIYHDERGRIMRVE